jgi:hypothetical protein
MKIFLFCLFSLLIACGKQTSHNVVIDTTIDIFVSNNSGANLLLNSTLNSIKVDSLRLFYLVNGEKSEIYNKDMDCPRNICFNSDIGKESIRIFPNDTETEEFPITYIQWENGETDELKCHFVRLNEGETVTCDKVWYNDVLMFPENAIPNFGRAFKIVR